MRGSKLSSKPAPAWVEVRKGRAQVLISENAHSRLLGGSSNKLFGYSQIACVPPITAVVVLSYFESAVHSMANSEILRAYRHLFRAALRAVRHSSPAKYQIRDTMRSAFRTGALSSFNNQRIQNTLHFLRRAELHAGMEHKILRNLLHVKYWRNQGRRDNRLLVTRFRDAVQALTTAELTSRLISPQRFGRIAGLSLTRH
jgi:hypothetical protein